jgi:hypothetical protein
MDCILPAQSGAAEEFEVEVLFCEPWQPTTKPTKTKERMTLSFFIDDPPSGLLERW